MTQALQTHQRLCLVIAAVFFVVSCAGPSRQPDALDVSVAKSEAKPKKGWSPDPLPGKPTGPGASAITKIAVPSVKKKPKATYHRNGPKLNVSMPDFEIPVTGAGGGKKSVWAPPPAAIEKVSVDDPLPQSWVGTDSVFLSTDFDDNGVFNDGYRFIPPDPHAAAGPNHLVNVVNTTIAFHQKDGTRDYWTSLADFFSSLSPLTYTFDPKVLYDQYENRWVVITMEQTQTPDDPDDTSRMFVAVSDDSDPNGTWYFSEFDTVVTIGGTDYWADYPGFAVDEEAVYITANLFGFDSGSFGGVRAWILEKGAGSGGFYDNGGTLTLAETDPYASAGIAVTTQPSHMFGTGPSGVGVFLVSFSGISSGTNELLQVVRVDNPLGPPSFTQTYISLGNIDNLSGGLPDMPQFGTSTLIESNDRRALDAVWRNNALWLTTTINPNSGIDSGEATALWIKVDTSNLASLSIADSGTIGGEDIATGTYTTFPSIAVNADEDVVVGFSASAPTIFAGAYFVDRQFSDPAGFTGNAVTVKAGVDQYYRAFGGSRNRWGDYSATAVDPVDGCFWVYNEWADTRGTVIGGEDGRWGTAYAKTCSTPVVCSASYNIPANVWTRFALPCSVAPNNTVAEVFGGADTDDLAAIDYGVTWVVYGRDSDTPSYFLLATTDLMTEGTGYWVYSATATQVDLVGSPAAINDIQLVGLHPAGRDNYVGHNQNVSVDWNQVQVVDGSNVLNYGDYDKLKHGTYECDAVPAKKNCVMSRKMQKWNGSAYQVFDGITPGALGTLDPFDAFWVQAFKPDIKLRIPVGAAAASASSAQTAPGVENSLSIQAKTKKPKKPKDAPWYIRLVASAGDMEDPGNVLGQIESATEGSDAHDLEEPLPFGGRYLSILFTNPLFELTGWGFTTDFRALTEEPEGVWPFVVKAAAGIHEVTIRWEGEDDLFEDAWLVDEYSGEMIRARPGESYTFEMEEGNHYFRFEVGGG